MKYIGSKFGHYYFKDIENNIFEISTLSDDVHFCCVNESDNYDFTEEQYSTKDVDYVLEKIDLLMIRLQYLHKTEKIEYKFAGTTPTNKYYLDQFNNVYGFIKKKPNDIHYCGLRNNKSFRMADLKAINCLDFKRKIVFVAHSDIEKPIFVKKKRVEHKPFKKY